MNTFAKASQLLAVSLSLCLIVTASAFAETPKPIKPSAKDKCPVCGMFVAKYTDWLAEIIFKDNSYAMFDGVKDMMKYYFDLKKYNPSKQTSDIKAMFVTDYYTLKLIDASKAYYVIGSDVFGPMGKELIPFGTEADAKEFAKDHKGKQILRFSQITKEIIKSLD